MNMRLPKDGMAVAWLLVAGFGVRAAGQSGVIQDPALAQGVAESVTLLFCLAFGYAIQGVVSSTYSVWLHLGAVCLVGGTILDALVGSTPIARGVTIAGSALVMPVMWQAARRAEAGFERLAILVASTGPALFALHAALFRAGSDRLSARFLRLAGAAAMALPLLGILYRVRHFGETTRPARLARMLLGIGFVAMPLVLVLSAFVDHRLKYGLAPASDCVTVALAIACIQALRRGESTALAGFGTLLVSMVLGKLMGFYAFDGPLSAPPVLVTYGESWRTALRQFHIDLMVVGYAFLLWPSLVRPLVAAVASLALMLGVFMPVLGIWSRLASVATVAWVVTFWRSKALA